MKRICALILTAVLWVGIGTGALTQEGNAKLPYSFYQNGYAIVCRGNVYGRVDTEGNEVMFPKIMRCRA